MFEFCSLFVPLDQRTIASAAAELTEIMALRLLTVLFAVTLACTYASRVEICGGETLTLSCRNGGQLQIHSALWGRKDNTRVRHCHRRMVGSCSMKDYTERVQSYCGGYTSCSITANGRLFSYFSCYWNEPYADITYTCSKKATTTTTTTTAEPTEPTIKQACVAGLGMKLLHCPRGSSVHITGSYVTTTQPCDNDAEGSGESPEQEEVDCKAEINVQNFFNVMCNMRRSQTCVLSINKALFAKQGLKCRGYHHYLHAQYLCR